MMSNLETELIELKSKYSQQLTRDEALDLAFQAAELHMKFLRIAKEGPEKTALSRNCSSILDQAERIKAKDVWDVDDGSLISFESLQPLRTPVSNGDTSSIALDARASSSVGGYSSSRSLLPTPQTAPRSSSPLSEARSISTFNSHTSNSRSQKSVKPSASLASSRTIPKKEQILLWQGSELHGCKFPPWEASPADSDFDRLHGELKYTYALQSTRPCFEPVLTLLE